MEDYGVMLVVGATGFVIWLGAWIMSHPKHSKHNHGEAGKGDRVTLPPILQSPVKKTGNDSKPVTHQ